MKNTKLRSAIVACDAQGRSPIRGPSFRSKGVHIASSPRLTKALRAVASRTGFGHGGPGGGGGFMGSCTAKVLNQTLDFKMGTATKQLTAALESAKGRRTVLGVARELFGGDCVRAVGHLVGMLQAQVKDKHFRLVEENMQAYAGSAILDPLCFPQPIDSDSSNNRPHENGIPPQRQGGDRNVRDYDEDGDAFSAPCRLREHDAVVALPLGIAHFHIGDEVAVRVVRRPPIHLRDEVEQKGMDVVDGRSRGGRGECGSGGAGGGGSDSDSDDVPELIGTIIRMDEATEKVLVLKHDSGLRHWYRARHLRLRKKCPDVDTAPVSPGECLKHIDSFVWQTQMDILRAANNDPNIIDNNYNHNSSSSNGNTSSALPNGDTLLPKSTPRIRRGSNIHPRAGSSSSSSNDSSSNNNNDAAAVPALSPPAGAVEARAGAGVPELDAEEAAAVALAKSMTQKGRAGSHSPPGSITTTTSTAGAGAGDGDARFGVQAVEDAAALRANERQQHVAANAGGSGGSGCSGGGSKPAARRRSRIRTLHSAPAAPRARTARAVPRIAGSPDNVPPAAAAAAGAGGGAAAAAPPHIRKSRSAAAAPNSTRALRNLSIISGSRVKALLRRKYQLGSSALGADATPFEAADGFFRKRLLHASNPGISQWVHRHFQVKNNFLNVSMKSGGQLKYAGSYCLRDFSHIGVAGQRIFCTFAIAADVKLILHARTQEAARWWGRRMRLHQAYFLCELPGMSLHVASRVAGQASHSGSDPDCSANANANAASATTDAFSSSSSSSSSHGSSDNSGSGATSAAAAAANSTGAIISASANTVRTSSTTASTGGEAGCRAQQYQLARAASSDEVESKFEC